jgi:uncharacterized phage protein gp47/JayE
MLAQLTNQMMSIYGSDIDVDPDSQDGQMLSIFAQAWFDTSQAAVAAFGQASPATAQGAGLSSVVKINGIRRQSSSNSTAVVAVVGQAGTTITGGQIGDNQNLGTVWNLLDVVVIPNSGTINATATCSVPGAIAGPAGTLTKILTPTAGWQTVTNATDASIGQPVEVDAALRRRQSGSVALAAETILEAIVANVGEVAGVSLVKPYENNTNATDANGVPAHSICLVVQGGAAQAIGNAIAETKSPGTGTFGSVAVPTLDANGVPDTINYSPLQFTQVYSVVTIKALAGYTAAVGTELVAALVAWINGLGVGQKVYWGKLWGPANLENSGNADGATYNVTALTVGLAANPAGVADVAIAFDHAAQSAAANIVLVVT